MLIHLTLILALGVGGMWIAWRLRMPSILVLLGVGLLAGPVARAITPGLFGRSISLDPSHVITAQTLMQLVGLAMGLILFEGGLTLNWGDIADVRRVVALLVTLGSLITWLLVALAARFCLGMDWPLAVLLGAVLMVTGPTVIGPLLRFLRPTGRVGPVLRWEGIVIDPIGALVALLAFETILSGMASGGRVHFDPLPMARAACLTLLIGVALGALVAACLLYVIRRHLLPDHLQIPATLACAVAVISLGDRLSEGGGLFASTVMGIVMANQRWAVVRHIVEFKENISTVLIAVLFVVLASRFELQSLRAVGPGTIVFLAALVLLVRPASVLVSTAGSLLRMNERAFLCGMAPRGIVAAGVASLFALRLDESGVADADLLITYTFLVVVFTVIVYACAAAPLARWLGLAKAGQRGFLIVGANPFARALAKFLVDEGFDVLVVDTNAGNIREARLAGLPVALGNALSSEILERVELTPLGHLLALTSNDQVNAMAAVQFARLFGRENVYQLPEKRRPNVPVSSAGSDRSLVGRSLFLPGADYAAIENWMRRGARIRKTRISESFGLGEYQRQHADRAIPLAIIAPSGIAMLSHDVEARIVPGHQIVSLVLPQETAMSADDSESGSSSSQ